MSEKISSDIPVLVDPKLVQQVLEDVTKVLVAQLPVLKQVAAELVDAIFIPKIIGKQLLLLIALDTGMITLKQLTALISSLTSRFSSKSRLIRQLQQEQQTVATTQDEWMELAEQIDTIQGNDVWRSDPSCPLYERERISARIDELVHLMRRRDLFELMFVLRGSIGRNKFGLLHQGLFSKALAGTKVLVETYHNVVCAALDYCCDAPVNNNSSDASVNTDAFAIPTDARLAFFNETRHAYGRSALLLSGGAALGFYHVGVVKTLLENRLMPRVIGGSSAGSIVCAMIGTRTDQECLQDLFQVRGTESPGHSGRLALSFFRPIQTKDTVAPVAATATTRPRKRGGLWEVYSNTAGAFHDAKRTFQTFMPIPLRRFTSFFYDLLTGRRRPEDVFKSDTEYFRQCVRTNVGNFTFQEAFDRTGRILNIVVTPNNSSDPPRLLNYLTAPHVMVWSAAVASSSLPGVFEANRLVVKEADGWERYESGGGMVFSDGSMEQDLPMQQLSEMFNINHFVISQANPHAVMFANYNQKTSVWSNPVIGFLDSILTFLKDQVRSWLVNIVECLGTRRIAPFFDTQRGVKSAFFTQEYEGRTCDISLIPWLSHRSLLSALLHVIYNPSEAEFREWIQAAERETWRFLPAIKSHIAEEVTIDRCVQRLRRRLLQESWDKQASAHATSSSNNKVMGSRVPSFFTSPSLVNMGGLNVGDQTPSQLQNEDAEPPVLSPVPPHFREPGVVPEISIPSGWGGMGLKGNRSSGNLMQRSSSDASGLFIEEEDAAAAQQQQQQQVPGENTTVSPRIPSWSGNMDKNHPLNQPNNNQGYLKTTSMATFYYRKAAGNSASAGDISGMDGAPPLPVVDGMLRRDQSQSHVDLSQRNKSV